MKRISLAFALLCFSAVAFAQSGVRYDGRATTVQTNMPTGANAPVLAIPGAKVLVCTTADCSTLASIFLDQALSIAAPNPIAAGGAVPPNLSGTWGFWGAAGTYYYKITTLEGIVYGPFPITLGGSGGGGSLTFTTETPSGLVNGSNTAFSVSHVPVLMLLTDNGLLLTPSLDYTFTGTSLTITTVPQTGDKLLAQYFYGTGPGTPFQQTPTGAINGSNTAFTLTHTPIILFLSRNGVQLTAGTDYTLSGASLTMTVAPQSGDTFNAQYFY